ncbi:MAG: TRAP transporter substrate-binding protein DctP [Treponema sp.]|jgi:TRAP-type C4-dicarboxylate transport system substrate-binding protein|nr:TRAP transporter substrate-binding protein DctP [Treponema sp.]
MKRISPRLLIALSCCLFITAGAFAQRGGRSQGESLVVKIASPLPKASPWGRTLDRLAGEWSRITNGQVRLNVRHDGIEGGEGKMLISLSSNTIQAAVFTSFGLSSISPEVMTMSAPFLIRNKEELDTVMAALQDDLEARINRTDYCIVAWSKSGFVNVFSKDPVFVPDDLRRQKIATNADATDLNTAFKSMGFQLVETDLVDVGTKLATGNIMAAYQNPAGVAAYHLHNYLNHMLSVNIAPILGGIIINQVTWKKIGELNPQYQREILRVTRLVAAELDASMQKTVNDAILSMRRGGLKVNQPTPAQEQLWFDDVERIIPGLLGTTFDRDIYNKINTILSRYRNRR